METPITLSNIHSQELLDGQTTEGKKTTKNKANWIKEDTLYVKHRVSDESLSLDITQNVIKSE